MSKRVVAHILAVSIALLSAGFADDSLVTAAGKGAGQGVAAAGLFLAAPISIPVLLIYCSSHDCKSSSNSSREKNIDMAELREKANSGDARAQLVLGNRYFHGFSGVARDDTEAAKWYRQSAEQGDGDAQLALGLMYEWGRGLGPDDVQADMWYTVAVSALSADSRAIDAKRAAENRDNIEQRMTPEQVAEARRRAKEWKPSSPSAPDTTPVSQTGVAPPRDKNSDTGPSP